MEVVEPIMQSDCGLGAIEQSDGLREETGGKECGGPCPDALVTPARQQKGE